jgi:iron complex outermembrane receptor protein
MNRLRDMAGILFMCAAAPVGAADAGARGLSDLSLEDLGRIEVTSVSGRAERLSDAPASIYVITNEDIRRSGANSLPEALRLAPNLQVARVDGGTYAISARGFNNAIANKLLVLIDGRTVYAPYYSGVQWDQQNVMLEDVERIEVISGPGATLWGANAVNGVINVITRSAQDTRGALAVASGGNRGSQGALRFGGEFAGGSLRAYAKTSVEQNTKTAAGAAVPDGWRRTQAGFRFDWTGDADGLTVQGDAYKGTSEHRGALGPFELRPIEASGANLLARWTRKLAGGSNIELQAYYDHTNRDDALQYRPEVSVADLQFKHGIPLDGHKVLWGAGYRHANDYIQPGVLFGFVPQRASQSWRNVFLQDEIQLERNVALTLGAKIESNDYTGWEFLPSMRLAWKVSDQTLVWGAVSRAVRAPARLDRDIRLPAAPPFIIAGGPDFVSEVAKVFELGMRGQPSATLSYSATLFHHDWANLRSGQNPPNAQVQNNISGPTYGAEAWSAWQATRDWRLTGGLTTLRKDLTHRTGATDPTGIANLGNDPDYTWMLRSQYNLAADWEFDVGLRRVSSLPAPFVPSYNAVDARLGWRATRALDLSLIFQNALDPEHAEFNAAPGRSEIARSVFLRATWRPW